MDNWGDPWADNADSKSPTKSAVTSPLPPTFAPAPPVLNGFLDDAGWGNDDDEFGDWSSPAPSKGLEEAAIVTTPDADANGASEHDGWAAAPDSQPDDHLEKPVSETSDSSTTIQIEDVENDTPTSPVHLQPDDESSARASTSASEASHVDATTESTRTSCEEENVAGKATVGEAQLEHVDPQDQTVDSDGAVVEKEIPSPTQSGVLNESSDIKDDDTVHTIKAQSENDTKPQQDDRISLQRAPTDTNVNAFVVDRSLLAQLFPPVHVEEIDEAPDDPIYSTSGRKAWYRLTRKQTLREYNHGNDDNNHVRVNWANSEIRTEVNKIVGRWAREDRISGTGPGARASFYWDTPVPVDFKLPSRHTRHQSAMPTPSAAPLSNRQSLPPLSTKASTAFDWSSPSNSAISPITLKHPAITKVQRQEGRAVSVDLTPRGPNQNSHARSLSTAHETPAVTSIIPPPMNNTSINSPDPWAGLDSFDAATTSKESNDSPVDEEEEDDWGEMVSTPTASTFSTTDPFPQAAARNNTTSSRATTPPAAVEAVTLHDQSPDTMHVSPKPIVRLRSTISPTSALFKSNAFIPLGAEQGPIGPGILKPTKRTASLTSEKQEEPVLAGNEQPTEPKALEDGRNINAINTFSSLEPDLIEPSNESSKDILEPALPSTPIDPPPTEPNADPWATADFSIFESTPPAPQPTPPPPPSSSQNPSSNAPKPFTRSSPPRNSTPPTLQPLTSATSSAQQRKAEEDAIIRDILEGLPDLRYMLRR